ncbi:hypothetical protein OESDEN_09847 [Oesophagostomum dentatum]|uniref:Uncharacterized protein n=1 Tax=Oesophagostomum dentatum TaxID=61180 RepID=A0A0B1T2C9_OESDE|nr:hypothetical protein OESDEN_09847 [Oesophagostomum dentatum]
MLRMWQRVQHALDAAMGLGPRFPPIAPAVAMAGCEPSAKVFVKFANDNIDDGVLNGKRVIEMEKERPTWFKKLF